MKIGIIGGSGKAGRQLTAEAIRQGHDVTAIVRDAKKVNIHGVKTLTRDIFAISPEDVAKFDVVINAFKAPEGREEQHISSMEHLIAVFEKTPQVRLLVVGGAGSLYTDASRKERLMDSIGFPKAYWPTASNMGAAFEKLKVSKVLWTYLSPAAIFDPTGSRTGEYTLGTDVLITNKSGESYVSYADYAIAMIDEAANGTFVNRRFTVVSEKEPLESYRA